MKILIFVSSNKVRYLFYERSDSKTMCFSFRYVHLDGVEVTSEYLFFVIRFACTKSDAAPWKNKFLFQVSDSLFVFFCQLGIIYHKKTRVWASFLAEITGFNYFQNEVMKPIFSKSIRKQNFTLTSHSYELLDMSKTTSSNQVQTDLFFAIKNKKIDKVRWMMKKGADYFVNMELPGGDQDTPLILCVKNSSNCAIPIILFEAGALPNIVDKTGRTGLSYAAEQGKLALVRLFLGQGSDPYLADEEGATPWMYALKKSDQEILDCFIDNTNENLPDVEKTNFQNKIVDNLRSSKVGEEKTSEVQGQLKLEEDDKSEIGEAIVSYQKCVENIEIEADSDEEFYRSLREDEIDTCFLFSK